MTMSSGAPNQYFFRGLLQSDKGFIWQSNSNLDVALYDSQELQADHSGRLLVQRAARRQGQDRQRDRLPGTSRA